MNYRLKQAFTLIELLVVIAIIGILSALIVVGMNSTTQKANIAKSQVFASSLRNSLMNDLVSEWKFDEGSGTTANDSWGSYTATLSCYDSGGGCTNPQWKTESDCVFEGCLYYDGVDDYVNHVNVNFSEGSPHTYSAWVKWSGSAPTASIVPFGGTGSCDFIQLYSSGSYTFMFRDHSPCTQTTITNSNTQTLYNEKWHFITWSINSSKQLFFYIDGLKNGDTMTLVNSAIYYNWIAKGYSATGFLSNYLWKGYIDEVRIFDAAIPTSQIQQNYFAGINKLLAKNQITQSDYQQRLANLSTNNFAEN